jgi:hypothetical protein
MDQVESVREPDEVQRVIVAGLFSDPHRLRDLAQRGVVGRQHPTGDRE